MSAADAREQGKERGTTEWKGGWSEKEERGRQREEKERDRQREEEGRGREMEEEGREGGREGGVKKI